jgi:hypothetical protein
MAIQTISIGSTANDGTGDPLRTAFTKINANFTELYGTTMTERVSLDTSPQLGGNLDVNGFNITSARSNEDIVIAPSGTGGVLASAIRIAGTTLSSDNSSSITIAEGLQANSAVNIDGAVTATSTMAVTGATTLTGATTVNNSLTALSLTTNTITSNGSNAELSIQPSGTGDVLISALRINGTTLDSADSTKVTIAEAVDITGALVAGTSVTLATGATVTGILDEDAMGTNSATQLATQQSIRAYADTKAVQTGSTNNTVATVTGANAFQGEANLTFNGSTLAVTGAGTFSTSLGVTGTLTTADITTTGTHTITGQSDIDWVRIKDHSITTNASNANLDISANGSGIVNIASNLTTVAQTVTGTMSVTGQFNADNLRIDGNVLSATSGGITLTPAANQTVALGGIATANELHATLGEFTTLRADKLEVDTSNGDMAINTQGTGTLDFNTPTQSTIGSAGGASALPGVPTGYLKIKVAGTLRVIPYWDQA